MTLLAPDKTVLQILRDIPSTRYRAFAGRKFDELFKSNASPMAAEAIQRIALMYHVERERGT